MSATDRGSSPTAGPSVVVDTDVYSRVVLPGRGRAKSHPDKSAWQDALLGRRLLISVQTRVELLALPLQSKQPWSNERITEFENHIEQAAVLQVTLGVQERFVTLTDHLRRSGHALAGKAHTGDRWVAATALANGLPLAAMDGIYRGVPGLELIKPVP